jgi:hypothetical protein
MALPSWGGDAIHGSYSFAPTYCRSSGSPLISPKLVVPCVNGLDAPPDGMLDGHFGHMNDKLKDTIQDCNVNFLIGSGLSCPFLTTLGNLESLVNDRE